MPIRIALDAMGGDDAPSAVIEGAVAALREARDRAEVLLFGPEATVRSELDRHDTDGLPIGVVDAPEVIAMDESPSSALKRKPNSSIHLGLGAHKAGRVDGFASAGNTGAVMAASLFILGRMAGVARPSLPGYFPTTSGLCIVMDVGANVDCKPEHLVQFAQMGSVYVERVMNRTEPSVGLLNVGEEPGKGNEAVKAAYQALEETPSLNFRGNVEGRDVLDHAADVVVCDGFVGNILLKFGESLTTAVARMIGAEMQRQQLSPDEQALVGRVLGGVQRRFDYETYGGTPLLGVDGTVVIGHGSSSARAFKQMVLSTIDLVERDVTGSIASALGA